MPVPATLADLPNTLPQEYTTTKAGDPFLWYDSGNQDRLLIFVTDERLALLENNDNWFVDGTFATVPQIYMQLFTIHARLQNGKIIPCVYVFLNSKTEVAYTRGLRQLKNFRPNLNPTTVLIDFEFVGPGVQVKGCYFHFTQNIWRKIQRNGLQDRYQQDVQFVEEVRMIAALAFVPEIDVRRVFHDLSKNIDPALDVIMDYVEETYIGMARRGQPPRPRYPYSMWGVYDRVFLGQIIQSKVGTIVLIVMLVFTTPIFGKL